MSFPPHAHVPDFCPSVHLLSSAWQSPREGQCGRGAAAWGPRFQVFILRLGREEGEGSCCSYPQGADHQMYRYGQFRHHGHCGHQVPVSTVGQAPLSSHCPSHRLTVICGHQSPSPKPVSIFSTAIFQPGDTTGNIMWPSRVCGTSH